MKKAITLFLTFAMALSLAACGGSGSGNANAGGSAVSTSSSGTATDPADDFYITIKFSNVFQPAEWNYKASEYLSQLVAERTEGHITLEYYGQNHGECSYSI